MPAKFLMRFLPNDNILRHLRFCKFCTFVIILVERLNFSQDDKAARAESIWEKMIISELWSESIKPFLSEGRLL